MAFSTSKVEGKGHRFALTYRSAIETVPSVSVEYFSSAVSDLDFASARPSFVGSILVVVIANS